MAEPVLIDTARGTYRLSVVEHAGAGAGPWALTLSVEHSAGLEKFAFRCHIAASSEDATAFMDGSVACARLAVWLQGQFEQIREAALKSIRSERRLAEFEFDRSHQAQR